MLNSIELAELWSELLCILYVENVRVHQSMCVRWRRIRSDTTHNTDIIKEFSFVIRPLSFRHTYSFVYFTFNCLRIG